MKFQLVMLATLISFLVSCSGGGGGSESSNVVKGSATQVTQESFTENELDEVKKKLQEDPAYSLGQEELKLLEESGEFTQEELAQLGELL